MSEIDDAFVGRAALSTPEVSELLDVSQARARAFADANDLRRIGPAFAWSNDDVEEFAAQLDEEDAEEEEDDDGGVEFEGEIEGEIFE